MKSRISFTFLSCVLSLFILSCNNNKTSHNDQVSEVKDSLRSELDTIIIGNKTLYFTPISKEEFDKYEVVSTIDTNMKGVEFKNGLFTFHLDNGAIATLENDSTEGDSLAYYNFIGFENSTNNWILNVTYYESRGSVLINKKSGDTLWLLDIPVLSLNRKYSISTSNDLLGGLDFNGLQLFEVRNNKLILIGERELKVWGPGIVKWIDNESLVAEKIIMDKNLDEKTEYIKIEIK